MVVTPRRRRGRAARGSCSAGALVDQAPTVPDGERHPLARREQALGASDIEGAALGVEEHTDDIGAAGVALRGLDRDRLGTSLDPCRADPGGQLLGGDDHAHSGAAIPEKGAGIGVDRETDQVGEGIGGELIVGARVRDEGRGIRPLSLAGEPRPAAARAEDGVDRLQQHRAVFLIESEGSGDHAVVALPRPEVSQVTTFLFPPGDARLIESVPGIPLGSIELLGGAGVRGRGQALRGLVERLGAGGGIRITEPTPDRIRRIH